MGPILFRWFYHHATPQANAEAVARVGVTWIAESQANGTAHVAGHIIVVAAPADRPRIPIDEIGLFMRAFRVEMVQNNLPYPT